MITPVKLVSSPTPLEFAPALSKYLGVELFIKRDDMAGMNLGGNKSRQLEYYIGDAVARDADCVLITGAVQSNFVRLAAAAARAFGMEPVVQLEDRVKDRPTLYHRNGNRLLLDQLGAQIIHYPEGEDEAGADAALDNYADQLRKDGRRPYVIHLSSGHPPIGALGYVDAASELIAQDGRFDAIFVASGSGATHAGLLAGLRGQGCNARVIGGCVRRSKDAQEKRIAATLSNLETLYAPASKVHQHDIELNDDALAPGYGLSNAKTAEAMDIAATHQGLLLDPVYTAKSFATLIRYAQQDQLSKGAKICFIHTGGLAALFAYGEGRS